MTVVKEAISALVAILVFPGLAFMVISALAFEWLDRVMIARLQGRVGPPWYQPVADLIKLLAKEDILPTGANEAVAAVLPVISLAAVFTAALYVPVAGYAVTSFEGDLIVVLFLLSLPALAYFLAGWVSMGVYSVVGGSRSLLQYFSYEVPFLMALATPSILADSWRIQTIVVRQPTWGVFTMPLGFVLAVVGLIGKLKRDPFDIPKASSEVVAGPLTEYSGRKLALWHLTVDVQTVVGILLLVNLFLGGHTSTFVPVSAWIAPWLFALKALLILVLLATASVLYARLRIDQLANLGWRVLAPLALAQIVVALWMVG
jgi:NADH-quinone oxidoreductase subunit H